MNLLKVIEGTGNKSIAYLCTVNKIIIKMDFLNV